MRNFFLILFLFLCLLVPTAFSNGNCELTKYDYHLGELALFNCNCDTNPEKNVNGYIVFRNASHILQSNAINSNDCINDLFGDSYFFDPNEPQNYIGNVTFSLNADGTGNPLNWDDAGDVRADNFNLTNIRVTDCLFNELRIQQNASVGGLAAISFEVVDGVTESPLVNARCVIDLYNIDRTPLGFEPYNSEKDYRVTNAHGEVGLMGNLNVPYLITNTNYLGEIHCYCPTGNDSSPCWLEETGKISQFKSCTTSSLFMTGPIDLRVSNSKDTTAGLSLILFFTVLIIGLFSLPFMIPFFSKEKITDFIIKRCIHIIAIFFTMYTGVLVAAIIDHAELGLSTEIIRVSSWIGWAGWISVLILFVQGLLKIMDMWKEQAKNNRMGE